PVADPCVAVLAGVVAGGGLGGEQGVEVFLHLAVGAGLSRRRAEQFVAFVEVVWSAVTHGGKLRMWNMECGMKKVGRRGVGWMWGGDVALVLGRRYRDVVCPCLVVYACGHPSRYQVPGTNG